MMALPKTAHRVDGEIGGWEDVLPGELTVGSWIFAFEGVGKVDCAVAVGEIELMLGSHLLEVETQGFEQNVWEHCHPVVLPFTVADDDLTVGKVEIFDAQAHHFH